jgi:hypothetical protein
MVMERRVKTTLPNEAADDGPLDEPIGRLGSSGEVRRHHVSRRLLLFAGRNRERFVGRVGHCYAARDNLSRTRSCSLSGRVRRTEIEDIDRVGVVVEIQRYQFLREEEKTLAPRLQIPEAPHRAVMTERNFR